MKTSQQLYRALESCSHALRFKRHVFRYPAESRKVAELLFALLPSNWPLVVLAGTREEIIESVFHSVGDTEAAERLRAAIEDAVDYLLTTETNAHKDGNSS